MKYKLLQGLAAAVLSVGAIGGGCDLASNTQPLTDAVTIGIVNKTPYRAVFTLGAWEPLDRESLPQFYNLRIESEESDLIGQGVGSVSTLVLRSGTATPGCRRAIAIGTADLIQQIKNKKDILDKMTPPFDITNEGAMIPGVDFSDAVIDSPDVDNPTIGTAEPAEANHGIDFPCGAMVVFTLVEDPLSKGGFRVDVGTISD